MAKKIVMKSFEEWLAGVQAAIQKYQPPGQMVDSDIVEDLVVEIEAGLGRDLTIDEREQLLGVLLDPLTPDEEEAGVYLVPKNN